MIQRLFEGITEIEKKISVDEIELGDGTKIWNLVRVLLSFHEQKKSLIDDEYKITIKKLVFLLKESVKPVRTKKKNIEFCAFSDVESRKLFNNTYYDPFMDPLSEIIDNFYIFEWPALTGFRYKNVYSKNYIKMNIPVSVIIKKIINTKPQIINEKFLIESISIFSRNFDINEKKLKKYVYESISIFISLKKYVKKILKEVELKMVFVRGSYGRFQMAVTQACREMDIPVIELQHGIIFNNHIGYVKNSNSKNMDCIPNYLLTWGSSFSDIVKKGTLFEKENVIDVGYPFLDKIKKSKQKTSKEILEFIEKFPITVLVTGQMLLSEEVEQLIKEISIMKKDSGILFKPHPRDVRKFNLEKDNILQIDKKENFYTILKEVDIHSTIFSTASLEALSFGKPNIFMTLGNRDIDIEEMIDIVDNKTSFSVNSPKEFIEVVEKIQKDYNKISKESKEVAERFYKTDAMENINSVLKMIEV